MTKISADVVEDFARLNPAQQQELLSKLQRYVDRGQWAAEALARIAVSSLAQPKPIDKK